MWGGIDVQPGKNEIPGSLRYSHDHLWVREEGQSYVLGWTEYMQWSAGDVNYVELVEPGVLLEVGQEFGSIETSKWVGKLRSPVAGRLMERNGRLVSQPELVNSEPYRDGWMVRIEAADVEGEALLSAEEYRRNVAECQAVQ
jgi:glycine cleavage system H protein